MYSTELSAAEVAIAERRGAWVTVVLSGPDGFEATCTTDATAPWFRKGTFGSVGKPTNVTALPARGIAAAQLGTGSIADKPLSIASGRVGADVAAISYTSSAKEEVIATVAKGQFAFWLPGNDLQNASDHGVPVDVTYRPLKRSYSTSAGCGEVPYRSNRALRCNSISGRNWSRSWFALRIVGEAVIPMTNRRHGRRLRSALYPARDQGSKVAARCMARRRIEIFCMPCRIIATAG
jgi:hypothetical protein